MSSFSLKPKNAFSGILRQPLKYVAMNLGRTFYNTIFINHYQNNFIINNY